MQILYYGSYTMPHIHTKPGQHDHTVSAYIIRLDTPQPSVMLHMHKKFGAYMQFGGHIELDETPWQAIAHEIAEETGYDFSQLKLLQPKERIKSSGNAILHPIPVSYNTHLIGKDHFHTDTAFAFVTNEHPNGKPADGESQDIRLFTREDLKSLSDKWSLHSAQVAIFIFDTCLKKWERVSTDTYSLSHPSIKEFN